MQTTMSMDEIKEIIEEYEYSFTTKFSEAIYIFPNGEMIDGNFDCGFRSEDHRMIECLIEGKDRYHNDFWDTVHKRLGVVRLVPETKYGLIAVGQELSEKQRKMLKAYRYKIEEY